MTKALDASRILAYSCPHFPYEHAKAFTFLSSLKKDVKPTTVVCLGDICDLHQLSKWPKHPHCLSPKDEIKEARDKVQLLANIFPKQLVCKSNHDERISRMAVQHGIPSDCVKPWHEIFKAPKTWEFAWEWEVGPALAIHGDRYNGSSGIRNAVRDNYCSTIMGHIHTEQGTFRQETKGGDVWGLQVGCLIDPTYAAFEYEQKNRNRPLIGAGLVINGVPQWVRLD